MGEQGNEKKTEISKQTYNMRTNSLVLCVITANLESNGIATTDSLPQQPQPSGKGAGGCEKGERGGIEHTILAKPSPRFFSSKSFS